MMALASTLTVLLLASTFLGVWTYGNVPSVKEAEFKRIERLQMSKTKWGLMTDSCVTDLVVLMDSSIDAGHLYQAVSSSAAMIDKLPVEPRNARVSIVDYGKGGRILFHLDQYGSNDLVMEQLDQIKYAPGLLGCPTRALTLARNEFQSRSVYRDPLKVAILFHNGRMCSGDFRAANDLRKTGVELYVVDLMNTASYPSDAISDTTLLDLVGDSDHLLSMADLPRFMDNFRNNFCTI